MRIAHAKLLRAQIDARNKLRGVWGGVFHQCLAGIIGRVNQHGGKGGTGAYLFTIAQTDSRWFGCGGMFADLQPVLCGPVTVQQHQCGQQFDQ